MRVLDIIEATTVDGPGFRTSVYLAGCEHRCPGCHNPQSWSHSAGVEMTEDELFCQLADIGLDVTFSGGDPMYQASALLPLMKRLKGLGLSVWVYTGFTFEEVQKDEVMTGLLDYVDVLVDGPYIESLHDKSLLFCGSANQRLINVPASLETGTIVIWESDF